VSGVCGSVWLVGAGPGDPELLTLKAVRVLGLADVVLHDDLVAPAILAHVRRGARIIAVGKRGGCASTPQSFIEQLLIREARAGRVVVRLKGGDPFVFGRGGEEVAVLRTAGIAVHVVSGVTSGIAAPAAAGIAVTQRGFAPGVAFVTGHVRDGGEGPDWRALAASGLTLVIYMGVAHCGAIARQLQDAGLAATTAAAIIENGTRPDQRVVRTTLGDMARAIAVAGIGSPAIMVIGDVANAADAAIRVTRSA